jgi:hypothetical protein
MGLAITEAKSIKAENIACFMENNVLGPNIGYLGIR